MDILRGNAKHLTEDFSCFRCEDVKPCMIFVPENTGLYIVCLLQSIPAQPETELIFDAKHEVTLIFAGHQSNCPAHQGFDLRLLLFAHGDVNPRNDEWHLFKCLRELEADAPISRTQYNTIPPTVEYALTERGRTLIPALESVYSWADQQMKTKEK